MREDKLPRKANIRVEAHIQPSPRKKVRRPPERGEETEQSPGGGGELTRTMGAKQPTHIRNPSVNRPREEKNRGGALERVEPAAGAGRNGKTPPSFY